MPEVTANGLRFNTQVLRAAPSTPGEKRPPVVMLHGLVMDNLSSWYLTIANPVAQHADVYLYDLRGHGRTDVPDEGYTIADNVADLVALLEVWGIDEPVHLVGNSFGCAVALEFARRSPERVASLFLIEAHYASPGWGEQIAASLDRVSTGVQDTVVRDYLADLAGRKFKKLVATTERLLLDTTIIEDLRAEPGHSFGEVTCPAVAVYGADSDILALGRALEQQLPRCELVVLEDCSHSLLMEAGGRLSDRVVDWVTSGAAAMAAAPTVAAAQGVAS